MPAAARRCRCARSRASPIKLIGTGEKVDALDEFHPARVANRILGMGDIVSLVEKAAETIDQEKALRIAEKMRKGKFDLEDLRDQLAQMEKIGGIGGMLGMLPGIGKMKAQLENANLDERVIKRQRAIIDSMTRAERRNPDVLKASRKKRIAAGSGTKVEDVNKLLKMHRQMADVMKAMGQAKRGGIAGALGNMFGLGGGMPQPTPEQIEALQKQMGGKLPDFPGAPGGGLPPLPPSLGGKGRVYPGSAGRSSRLARRRHSRSGRRNRNGEWGLGLGGADLPPLSSPTRRPPPHSQLPTANSRSPFVRN